MLETYEQFRERFGKYHTCGYEVLGPTLSYSSDCPRCEPEEVDQWEKACKQFFAEGRTVPKGGWWYSKEELPGGRLYEAARQARKLLVWPRW